jgi:protein gp37
MGTASKIEWTDHTLNVWRGCEKVSAGCDNCYAEAMSHRNPAVLGEWGPDGTRAMASADYWKLPFKWDRMAKKEGRRHRVFCLSLGDWLEDRPELIEPRARLLETVEETPNLDWLLLTKRPEGWEDRMYEVVQGTHDGADMIASQWLDREPPSNVWVGVSTEDQAAADLRIPVLLAIPAVVRFISAEPLLGPIVLRDSWIMPSFAADDPRYHRPGCRGVDWVIVGGESGAGARPMNGEWARYLRDQCQAVGVSYFFKQWGDWVEEAHPAYREPDEFAGDPRWRAVEIGDGRYTPMMRVGKHAAGRVLDGRTWEELPR